MEQFGQLEVEGFDKENTSQYSSIDPMKKNIENASANIYDWINMHNPVPAISKITSDAYNNLSDAAKTVYSDAKNINIKDFYASRPADSSLRNIMQNPSINRVSDAFSKYVDNSYNFYNPNHDRVPMQSNITQIQPNFVPMQPIINPHQNKSIINYNTVLLLVVLILIFIAWKYWAKK